MSDNEVNARVLRLGAGIPGAIVVLAIIKRDHEDELEHVLEKLEQKHITGSEIWLIYKRLCQQDILRFINYDFHAHQFST